MEPNEASRQLTDALALIAQSVNPESPDDGLTGRELSKFIEEQLGTALNGVVNIPASSLWLNIDTWAGKYALSCYALGWNLKTLLNQLISSYCAKYHKQYIELARLDAISRGYETQTGEYFDHMVTQWKHRSRRTSRKKKGDLRAYEGDAPAFEASPLAGIEVPADAMEFRFAKSVIVSEYNAVILGLIWEVERLDISDILSRIAIWHFDTYWATGSYTRQLNGALYRTLDITSIQEN